MHSLKAPRIFSLKMCSTFSVSPMPPFRPGGIPSAAAIRDRVVSHAQQMAALHRGIMGPSALIPGHDILPTTVSASRP